MPVGKIKWFNDQKGYGFITPKNGKDVFIHHSAINMNGYRTLKENDEVEFEVVEGERGSQAANVRKI